MPAAASNAAGKIWRAMEINSIAGMNIPENIPSAQMLN